MLAHRVWICAALLVAAAATIASPALASDISLDPYTLPDGTVVDPSNPNSAAQPRSSNDSIYTTLSNDGPMSGMGRPHGKAHSGHARRGQLHDIRSEQDDGHVV